MEGTPVKIGKVEYVVPEASLEVAEQVFPLLSKLGEGKNDAEIFGGVAEIVRICLLENYPDLSTKDVKKAMPLRRALALMDQVLRVAGFERMATSGEASAGETSRP